MWPLVHAFFSLCFIIVGMPASNGQSLATFNEKPASWFEGAEAQEIATHILLFQRNAGGWSKGKAYNYRYTTIEQEKISNDKQKRDCTFDNGATYTELIFLARICSVTDDIRYKDAFNRGLDFIFEAQYDNGGWPQYYPESHKIWSRANSKWSPGGIEHYITFNDDVMIGIMRLLQQVADGREGFGFVDKGRREKALTALNKGLNCILQTQFYYDGKKTGWPAQLDEVSLEPRWGRTFEPPAIAASESAEIVRFLMGIEDPGEEIIAAVHSAVAWFDAVKITDMSIRRGDTVTIVEEDTGIVHTGRRDTYLEPEPGAPPIWARFYELNTFRPVFCSRSDTVKYHLADISLERRSGYSWYGDWPERLLAEEYREWCHKNKTEYVLH